MSNKKESIQEFENIQAERKKYQAAYDALSVAEQRSQSACYRTRMMMLEQGLKTAQAVKTDKLSDELEKLKDRIQILERPDLRAVI